MLITAPAQEIRRHNMNIFSILFNMKLCCVFSLQSPHRGNSKEYTQYTVSNIKKKITLKYLKSAAMGFFFQEISSTSLK